MTRVATQVPVQMRLDKERDKRRPQWKAMEEYLSTSSGICGTVDSESAEEDATIDETEQNRTETVSAAEETNQANEGGSAAPVNDPDSVAGGHNSVSVDEGTKLHVKGMIKDASN